MFQRFRAEYAPLRDAIPAGSTWRHERLVGVDGYLDFASEFAGATFGGGLYRVHDHASGAQASTLIAEAFPEYATRVCPFGYDWLGRQFAVDSGRTVAGQPQVLLLEPGTGEALEVPLSFAVFHDKELVEYAEAALATGFFDSWSGENGDSVPLRRDQCVGYRVPLFLGGQDVIENLEVSDLEVYWSICGQLRRRALNLPPGTVINGVTKR
ncbi:T6SS immunity protein Tdi1 domain-containing protein [Amycolatopsis rhabdoformis]|uniref:T6SS immunity protein Tdi1 domain-containing protein n=1 Tax=Amycolatopsis rhabdoformis TaxID=1448059 RepID=A0ABZ1HY82_9PSEU|nr:T6SS immunity protein Tdi1 domain-containing protein [Amycolatopsis rhabdoformis]WSE26915.1 T6SS immunity protein Tdi1 domain-containing protein [Amycolatopsis rhabdoformis]